MRSISAKYIDELKFASKHAAALSCPGARYVRAPINPRQAKMREARPRDGAVLIALPTPRMQRWHPDLSQRAALADTGYHARRSLQRSRAAGVGFSIPVYTPFVQLLLGGAQSSADILAAELPLRKLARRKSTPLGSVSELAMSKSEIDLVRLGHCPTMPRYWWPHGAVAGYCEATEAARDGPSQGDCEAGQKGTFVSFTKRGMGGHLQSIRHCAKLCAACSRCRYISVSLAPDVLDCSWYHACDLANTKMLLPSGRDFVSMSLDAAHNYTESCQRRFRSDAC
jgi:hypothetical protein